MVARAVCNVRARRSGVSADAEDSAAAILAGLIETVRVMTHNSCAAGAVAAADNYSEALLYLAAASDLVVTAGAAFDAYTNPLDRIAKGAGS